MSAIRYLARGSCLIGLIFMLGGCIIAPPPGGGYHEGYHEGYYDRDHHRWWHNHGWHDCDRDDRHCR